MTPIAQLIAELREIAAHLHEWPVESRDARERVRHRLTRAAEALARQEELLAEAGKVVEPFAEEFGDDIPRPDDFNLFGNLSLGHFRAAARLSDKLGKHQ